MSSAEGGGPPKMASLDSTLAWWRGFDLCGKKRSTLEAEVGDILARSEESAAAKRELQEATKAFKKLPALERVEAVNPLVMKFQQEIESLGKRAKAAERAYQSVVKELFEAPDPALALAPALEATRALPRLREENLRLAADCVEARTRGSASAGDAAAERDAARREVAALEVELSKLANQDITIRQLEGRIAQIDSGIEAAVAERLAARESEMRRMIEAELETVRETETAAEGRVASLTAQLADCAAERDAAQAALFAQRSAAEEEAAARGAEGLALAAEVERLRSALGASSAQCEDLKRRLSAAVAAGSEGGQGSSGSSSSSAGSSSSSSSADPYAALRAAVEAHRSRGDAAEEEASRLSQSLAALQEEGRRWKDVLESARGASEGLLADAAKRLAAREEECSRLRAELAALPSAAQVAGLQRQLRLLQALHFNAGSSSGSGSGSGGGSAAAAAAAAAGVGVGEGGSEGSSAADSTASSHFSDEDVTTVMLRRVRQLEGELVRAETARGAAAAAAAESRAECERLKEALADSRALCATLEDTLAGRLSGGGGGGSGGVGGGGASPSSYSASEGPGGGLGDDSGAAAQLASLVPSLRGEQHLVLHHHSSSSSSSSAEPGSTLATASHSHSHSSTTSGSGGFDAGGVALALRGQRDRFRVRMLELESELQTRTAELGEATSKCNKLVEDNVKLFEKIRFLQFMASSGGSGSSSSSVDAMERGLGGAELRSRGTAAAASHAAAAAEATEDEVDSLYGKLYAAQLDPFAEYKSGEKARGYAALRRTDRIVYRGSSLLLSSRYTRKALFFYAITLHLLFFWLLWSWIHSDCGSHAEHAGAAAAAASAAVATATEAAAHHLRGPQLGLVTPT